MLELFNIKKKYSTGGNEVDALKGVSLNFRRNEFVSILGPSGCGKTTLLNIIGGLDHYTEGNLVIKGKSTEKYTDREWDSYRNHSVGFVFQSYNLIPHQSVLANVELALTLSGINKRERQRRAIEALIKVGLEDQINKKPSQLSGGQMQRVAIARAIVNNPEILLADEPTGALDSETSIQIMDILKEISADRLVIMVTHNPELAEQYSTRIIKLCDGIVTSDSMPYNGDGDNRAQYTQHKTKSMSFFTAFGLSVKNLMTKKGRTIMTCFAGSIGIIGIALIMAVSNGVNTFINTVQEDTLAKYPLIIEANPVDMSAMLTSMSEMMEDEKDREYNDDRVHASNMIPKLVSAMSPTAATQNNIQALKNYIEQTEEFKTYASAVRYSYPLPMNFYTKGIDGKLIKADSTTVLADMYSSMGISVDSSSATNSMMSSYSEFMKIWEELLPGDNGELIGDNVKKQYTVLSGNWPQNKNEVVLILSENNEVNDFVLYALGMKSSSELGELMSEILSGKEVEPLEQSWSYDEIVGKKFHLIMASDMYEKQSDGSYVNLAETEAGLKYLYDNPDKYTEITISGIIKPSTRSYISMVTGSLGYTSALTDYMIEKTETSPIIIEQVKNKDFDIIANKPFKTDGLFTESDKITTAKEYISSLNTEGKAELYTSIMCIPTGEALAEINKQIEAYLNSFDREAVINQMLGVYAEQMGVTDTSSLRKYFDVMSDDDLKAFFKGQMETIMNEEYSSQMKQLLSSRSPEELSAMLDSMLSSPETQDAIYLTVYEDLMPKSHSESSYQSNLTALGYVNREEPSDIIIYSSTFSDKNKINDIIDRYNDGVSEEDKIVMTDYVELLMSSVSTVINAISYVLIAFVGISLVVSSIMIGVFTNISVLERTKEIGILRAVGASKGDVGRVFNAETFIIGTFAGVFGIAVTLLLIIPINIILHHVTDLLSLNAVLPVAGAVILILLSMLLTTIAGLIPARSASKKDPVVALRTE